MPDLTPSPLRSKANGIINFMGGFGALLALFAGGKIYDINKYYPFIGAAGLMIAAIIILKKFIKEPAYPAKPDDESGGIIGAFKEILTDKDKSALYLLFAILFWFIGYQGIEALFTLYGVKYLGLTEGVATTTLGFFSGAFLAFAIPSGILATKIGRKKTIQIGLIGLALVFAFIVFTKSIFVIRILLVAGGICWALININSYPMVVEMASNEKLGAYTGLYYFFSSLAAILGPPLFGKIIDIIGFGALFIAALCFLLVALLFISLVKKGEVKA
jgi:MFS family permease